MREKDIEAAKSLSEDFVKIHQEWFKELSSMVDGNQKADIQALSEAFGINYLMIICHESCNNKIGSRMSLFY
jgi:DNA topoisomerase VI subunit A